MIKLFTAAIALSVNMAVVQIPTPNVTQSEVKMNNEQLRSLITKVLDTAPEPGIKSYHAIELLMLTAAVESNLGEYIYQINGPALGIFQMEPATERDIWNNYLAYNGVLKSWVNHIAQPSQLISDLECNLAYQIVMARLHYYRVRDPLPTTPDGYAEYWKKHYNTSRGRGEVSHAITKYKNYVEAKTRHQK